MKESRMRLELHGIRIREIRFGDKTGIQGGVLSVSRDELRELLESDKRLEGVDIALASPGESCRIAQVADVMEPRIKMGEALAVPGGKHASTGHGKTRVLKDAAVVLVDCRRKGEDPKGMPPRDHIIDMSGPGGDVSTYGKTFNVVLLPKPKEGLSGLEYQAALKIAGLKTSAYLARAGEGLESDEREVYELPPLTEVGKGLEGLPRITYIFQVLSLQYEPIPGDPTFFGAQAGGIAPTILHPNQILDGAITSALPGLNMQTYRIQNHPIIQELYRRHGKDLCFAGVIAMVAHNNFSDFDWMAELAASIAKWVVGADGAILTKTGGGAPELAMAATARKCEQMGIKTAIAMLHMGADAKDAKFGASTIFSMPEVDAIVSMGFPFTRLALPAVERVIGPTDLLPEGTGPVAHPLGSIYGALDQMGSSRFTAVRY
jgi:glycine reductase complex component B subunit alpha and beta